MHGKRHEDPVGITPAPLPGKRLGLRPHPAKAPTSTSTGSPSSPGALPPHAPFVDDRYGSDRSGEGKQEFGMPAIFDNVRDGLILVRYPEEVVVLFNRAASDTCGLAVADVLGGTLHDIIPDPRVRKTAKYCSEQAVGEWPGHNQDVLPSKIDGPDGTTRDVELHFCRVDDPQTGKPLVLLVMRPDDEELEALAAIAKKAKRHVNELEVRLRKRREEALRNSANLSIPPGQKRRTASAHARPAPKVKHARGGA